MTKEREWIPVEYSDEYVPEGLPDVQDWILETKEGFFLKAPPDWLSPDRPLVDGEVVKFTTCVDHGETMGRWQGGKLTVDLPMPPKATCVLFDCDDDTLSSSIEELEQLIKESDGGFDEGVECLVEYYDWPTFSFRFDVVNKAFFRCDETQRSSIQ